MKSYLRLLALAGTALLFASCRGDTGDDAGPLSRDAIDAIALRQISAPSDSSDWLTEIVAVFDRGDEVVVVDRSSPHVRVFSDDGGLQRSIGASGDGPGELGVPWRAALTGDTLYVLASGRVTLFDLVSLEEIGRVPAPVGAISLHPHCSGDLSFSIVLEEPSGEGARMAGIDVLPSAQWERGSFGDARPARFIPVGLDFLAFGNGDTIRIVDPWRGGLVASSCEGSEHGWQPLEGLETWVPRPASVKGQGAASGAFVLFVGNPDGEGTRALIWQDDGLVTRDIAGDLRMYPAANGRAWIIHNELRPTLTLVRIRTLVEALSG